MLNGCFHQLVIAWVKFHQIDAIAKAVMRIKLGLELIGQIPQLKIIDRARHLTKLAELGVGPLPALALHRLAQGGVLGVHVVVAQLGGQVAQLMGVGQVDRVGCGVHTAIH